MYLKQFFSCMSLSGAGITSLKNLHTSPVISDILINRREMYAWIN